MGALKDIFSEFLADASPEERARVLRLLFRIIVSAHILWACGFLAPMGLTGFVFADDVDSKIESAVKPIYGQLGAITSQLADQDAVLKAIRSDQLATTIRELHAVLCLTENRHDRERLAAGIEVAQRQYRALVGDWYPLDGCTAAPP